VKTLLLLRLAAAALIGALLLATSGVSADDLKDQKPAPFTPPTQSAPAASASGAGKETVQSTVNRLRANSQVANTGLRPAPLAGATQSAAKHDTSPISRTSAAVNTGVRANSGPSPLGTYRTTYPPTTHTPPLSRNTALPASPSLPGSKSSSPTLRERIRNLLR
jgi:hypothetical protein